MINKRTIGLMIATMLIVSFISFICSLPFRNGVENYEQMLITNLIASNIGVVVGFAITGLCVNFRSKKQSSIQFNYRRKW